MDENALTCSHCNYQQKEKEKAPGWRKCVKCGMLWCPKCAPVPDRCSNCIGGVLVAIK